MLVCNMNLKKQYYKKIGAKTYKKLDSVQNDGSTIRTFSKLSETKDNISKKSFLMYCEPDILIIVKVLKN